MSDWAHPSREGPPPSAPATTHGLRLELTIAVRTGSAGGSSAAEMTGGRALRRSRKTPGQQNLDRFHASGLLSGESPRLNIGSDATQPTAGPIPASAEPAVRAWAEQVEEFLLAKGAESPVGAAWIRRMKWELSRCPALIRGLGTPSPPGSARELTAEHIQALREGMGWEKATIALHFAALRQFARWAANPIAQSAGVWRLPSGQPSHRRWLTKAQLSSLLSAARGREKVLVALEGLNGLRRVEVLRLRRKDVLLEEGCMAVLGKGRNGGKWRKIPLHPVVKGLLRPLVRGMPPEERLFGLSASGADGLLQRAARRAAATGPGIRVSHHDLRRTFGRIAHGSGMDLVQLKNLLGHSSVEMTVHYIGLDADRMREGLQLVSVGGGRARSRGV
jgi:integrase